MSIHWPPSEWDEDTFHHDQETRLPMQMYPFILQREHVEGRRYTGRIEVRFVDESNNGHGKLIGTHDDIWLAYRAMLDAYQAWFPTRPQPQIYFIGSALRVGCMVKVGYSVNPKGRLRQLQTSSPERLQIFVTVPGTVDDERKYHRRWSSRRRTGEWFVLGDCIIDEINRLKARSPNLTRLNIQAQTIAQSGVGG
jgi:hypothetical protein